MAINFRHTIMSQHFKRLGGKLSFKLMKQKGNMQTQREEEAAEEEGGQTKEGRMKKRRRMIAT